MTPKEQILNVAKSRPKNTKKTTPADTKSVGPSEADPLGWSEDVVTIAHHRRKLNTLLASDPVAKSLEIQLLGLPGTPVSPLPRLRTVTEAVNVLVTLLREVNKAAGM
uniref:Uncharacterized protein n=1 Tax=Peronospora matthiolae TaxID=2874970 RepID=A0AAV1UHN2_9STRA